MKLIWTYSEHLKKGPNNSKLNDKFILDMYGHSIECGKKFYDKTCVYTTELNYDFFKDKVDEVKLIPNDFDYVFLGDLKYHVIETEKSPFMLIDGDLFLEEKLNIPSNCEIAVEMHINLTLKNTELKFNECFVNEGIKEIIPYWIDCDISYNLGLIYINTEKYVLDLCNDFKKVKTFYKEKIEPKYHFDKQNKQPSVSGVQYFFTMFLNKENVKPYLIKSGNVFTHLSGDKKFKFKLNNEKKLI
jgi:hypothetical protein